MLNKIELLRNSVLILISAFFLSCEDPTNIGLPGSGGNEETFFTDTLSIEMSTYLMDSAITSGQSAALVGSFYDPSFGNVTSVAYLQPSLVQGTNPLTFQTETSPLTTPDNAVYDSLVLSLINRDLIFYGDSIANMTIEVHRLSNQLVPGKNYNYDEEQNFEGTLLASKTLTRADFFNPADTSILYINMKLPDALGLELMALANKDASATNEAFAKAFKGFRISAKSGSKTLVAFNLGSASTTGYSRLNLLYHEASSSTANGYTFEFNSTRYNKITSDRTGTPLASLTRKTSSISSAQTNNNVFVQAGTGVAAKLNFPALSKLTKPQISRAEIEFSADSTTLKDGVPLAPFITFIEVGDNQRVKRVNNSYGYVNYTTNPTSGILSTYNDSTNLFVADITPYLQGLTAQQKNDNGLLLVAGVPASSTSFSALVFNAGLNRIVLRNFKLNLYYSEK